MSFFKQSLCVFVVRVSQCLGNENEFTEIYH